MEHEMNATAYPDLIGSTKVAQLLDVSPQRVRQLVQQRSDFPRPALTIAGGEMLWDRSAIERWRDTADRRPGRRADAS
jgi:hypothetical protein